MTKPIKLLLAIPHLGGGGAERVTAQLARHLDPERFEIHLALVTDDAPGATTLPGWVTIHRLHAGRVRNSAVKLISLVRTLRPGIIVSGMAHLNFLFLLLKPLLPSSTRLLIRQNTTASAAAQSALSRFLYRHLYPRADLILCQSQAMAADLTRHFGILAEQLVVVHNPIDFPLSKHSRSNLPPSAATPTLLAVSRLSHEKGVDQLLKALALVRAQHPEAQLTVLGVGAEEANLRELARKLDLAEAVRFAGQADPAEYFASATLFVLPSRYEGLPNALLEAAAAGLPIVATPCSGGVIELLRDAPGTWLAEEITPEAMARSISAALRTLTPERPQRFRHEFVAPFESSVAVAAYEEVFTRQSKPRIAMLIPTIDQIGGAERQVLLLAKALAARLWTVTLIALSGDATAQQEALAAAGVGYMSLDMRKAWLDPRGWLRFLRWAANHRPEILHSHLPHATFFGRLVRLLSTTKAVVDTIHTSKAGPRSRRLAYRLTNWLSDQVTCVSESVAESVRRAGIAASTVVIPNGIELPPTLAPRAQAEVFRWIAVGRLSAVKDYPTMLRAFAMLSGRPQLTILGTGPDEACLRGLAAELHLEERVHFAGFQSEVRTWLPTADAFVLSSLWEGLPISVLEASASGLPVVVTDGPGTSESMLPGITGLLVKVGSPEALANAMSGIMAMEASQREAMGAAGRAFVERHYALPEVVRRWESLYSDLFQP